MTKEEWDAAIAAERKRQIEKGYSAEHDDEEGIDHLLSWAQRYAWRGQPIKAAALLEAASEVLFRRKNGVNPDGW